MLVGLPLALMALSSASADDPGFDAEELPLPLEEFAASADFVFRGTVTAVDYRNSEAVPVLDGAGRPVLDEEGRPAMQEGSDLPHTFVTYRVERTYKGRVEDRQVTLRFLGGLDEEPLVLRLADGSVRREPQAFTATGTPLFDAGDRDILFVQGNTDAPCPLVRCDAGRFRLIEGKVFSDRGDEIVELPPEGRGSHVNTAGLGAARDLEAVNTNIVGPLTLMRQSSRHLPSGDVIGEDSETAPAPRSEGRHLEEKRFEKLVASLLRATGAKGSSANAEIVSADPGRPFVAVALRAAPPAADDVPRPGAGPSHGWLEGLPPEEQAARMEAAEAERRALERNGGNPVIRTPAS